MSKTITCDFNGMTDVITIGNEAIRTVINNILKIFKITCDNRRVFVNINLIKYNIEFLTLETIMNCNKISLFIIDEGKFIINFNNIVFLR